MLISKIKLIFMMQIFFVYIAQAQNISLDDVYAEYCWADGIVLTLNQTKILKEIKSFSFAETDTVACIYGGASFTTTSITIQDFKPILWLNRPVGGKIGTRIRTRLDTSTGNFSCTMESIPSDSLVAKKSSLIQVKIPIRESFSFKDESDIPPGYMQRFSGKNILAELNIRVECRPLIDTTYSFFYPIRITGECPKEDSVPREHDIEHNTTPKQ